MTITDHINIIWPNQDISPTQAELDTTRSMAQEIFDNEAIATPMTAIRLAIVDFNLYESLMYIMNNIPDETEKLKTQTWWSTAQSVRRDHSLVMGLGSALGLTEDQIKALFVYAKKTYE